MVSIFVFRHYVTTLLYFEIDRPLNALYLKYNSKDWIMVSSGGGLVVNLFTFYSDDLSLNPPTATILLKVKEGLNI